MERNVQIRGEAGAKNVQLTGSGVLQGGRRSLCMYPRSEAVSLTCTDLSSDLFAFRARGGAGCKFPRHKTEWTLLDAVKFYSGNGTPPRLTKSLANRLSRLNGWKLSPFYTDTLARRYIIPTMKQWVKMSPTLHFIPLWNVLAWGTRWHFVPDRWHVSSFFLTTKKTWSSELLALWMSVWVRSNAIMLPDKKFLQLSRFESTWNCTKKNSKCKVERKKNLHQSPVVSGYIRSEAHQAVPNVHLLFCRSLPWL